MATSSLSIVESYKRDFPKRQEKTFRCGKSGSARHSRGSGRSWPHEQALPVLERVRRAPDVEAWFAGGDTGLRPLARSWFERLRDCGEDVRELLHDGHPTACVDDAAFAYVDAFSQHVNLGFYEGATLDDPAGLLEGAGKRMRHVKLPWGQPVDEAALGELIAAAHRDMRARVDAEA
jgi:hypothetical protein